MKTTIYILIALFFSINVFAQGGKHHQKRKEIMKKQVEFIISKLQLTEKEKKDFIPLYKEYANKKEALHQQKRESMQAFKKNNLNMSDEELTNLADMLVNTDIQIAELGKTYHNKYKLVLAPIKIILLHKAEQQFKRELFKHMKRKGKGKRNNN